MLQLIYRTKSINSGFKLSYIKTQINTALVSSRSACLCTLQLCAVQLISKTVEENQGTISSLGALIIKTGKFTGRSPK
ncbi:MAG: hypothetical protein VX031_02420, partial [Bacteroidota bacterium]|nr:hypothetical protein [Bacteroidota bacterium]